MGWQQVLEFIDQKLTCRSFLAAFDENGAPQPQFGGLQAANEIGSVLHRIETEGGRSALHFLLSEASLFYPYCKTSLAGGRTLRDPAAWPADFSATDTASEPVAHTVLQSSPGLISPIWRTEGHTVLFGCLFITHTPATIDVAVASDTFRKIVQALSPGLKIQFQLQEERTKAEANQVFVSAMAGPAVLIDAGRRILIQTASGVEALTELDAGYARRHTLVFKNKQIETCLSDLLAAYRSKMDSPDADPSPAPDENGAVANADVRSVFVATPDGFLKRISIEAVNPPQDETMPVSPWFLLRVRETADVSEAVEDCLQSHYDLSQSEAHLARQLTVSGSMHATIESLGITRNTAKTHLRRIYEKTGAHTQLQLARLVHRLAKLF
ncbi:helix-turn-helix transcriptional regulator [Roseibium sp. M-1]